MTRYVYQCRETTISGRREVSEWKADVPSEAMQLLLSEGKASKFPSHVIVFEPTGDVGVEWMKFPCHCASKSNPRDVIISQVIIHLNDQHSWTREAIADWLETLDVDLSFPTPD